jgi:hypothetical protein
MELVLRKSQSKGFIGGISFEVSAQVRLNDEEQALVQKYKQEATVVLQRPLYVFGQPTDRVVNLTVGQLVRGEAFKCKDLGEVLGFCENARQACVNLFSYLEVARSFGGEEVIQIPGKNEEE